MGTGNYKRALRLADGLTISVVGGLLVALILGQVGDVSLQLSPATWVVGACLALLVVRAVAGVLVAWAEERAEGERSDVIAQGSYGELVRSLPTPLPTLIESAGEIQILGGTMIEFVRQADVLRALGAASSHGTKIEVIMLDPNAEILRAIAAERAEGSRESAEAILERLRGECEFSLERLLATIPPKAAEQSLRLSSAMPHHAFTRLDDSYILTTYTFARGGSAPSILLEKTAANAQLCAGLTRGFSELWASNSVRAPR